MFIRLPLVPDRQKTHNTKGETIEHDDVAEAYHQGRFDEAWNRLAVEGQYDQFTGPSIAGLCRSGLKADTPLARPFITARNPAGGGSRAGSGLRPTEGA